MSSNKDSRTGVTSGIVNSVDQMVKLPFQMTGATWDLMMQGMRSMTRSGDSGSTMSSSRWDASSPEGTNGEATSSAVSSSAAGQDLSGDDLKYVVWSIVFTKPGFECVLEPQRSEIVNYSADVSSFAAVKIAKFLERARHGHIEKAESWSEHGYPPESAKSAERRTDVVTSTATETKVSSSTSGGASASSSQERGWRIPAEDQKYITFLHRVEWRLPKQEEVTRVERVTIERGTTRIA